MNSTFSRRRGAVRFFSLGAAVALVAALGTPNIGAAQYGDTDDAAATAWTADSNHSTIGFSVRHFFTPISGTFGDYEIDLHFQPDNPVASSVNVVIQVESIETGVDRRNNHLRSPDFFNVEEHPTITFTSSSVRAISDDELVASGTLTIKGISKEMDLPIKLVGVAAIPEEAQAQFGKRVASFTTQTEVDRRNFEVGTGSWAETAVVGADVTIEIAIEAVERPVETE